MPSPAFQFYPDDFVGSGVVQAAEADEIGAYVLLLCLDWGEVGFAFDEKRLARVCRVSVARFRVIWSHLKDKFPPRDGRHYNPRLERERQKQAEWKAKSAAGGRASAESKRANGGKGGARVVEPPHEPSGQPNANIPFPSPTPELLNYSTPPAAAAEPPAEPPVGGAVNWPADVAHRWSALVGPIDYGIVGKKLGPFVARYPGNPARARDALVCAVDNFAKHRSLAIQNGDPRPDNWPQFVRDLLDYVPRRLKPEVAA